MPTFHRSRYFHLCSVAGGHDEFGDLALADLDL